MANITDQFVTSFSQLFFSTVQISASDVVNPTDTEVRAWFDRAPTQQIVTAVVTTSAADAVITLDGTEFTGAFATDATGTAAALAVVIDADSRFTATASSGTITITGVNLHVFVVADGTSVASTTVAFVEGTHQVPLVMEIGTLSNEATVIDTPTFGDVYRGKLRGQLDGGQLDAQLYWAPRNPIHQEIRNASENGVQVYVGIKWNSDALGTDSEFVYFDSFVSSFGIDTTFDDVAKVSATFVVDGAEHFASAV